MTDRTVVHLVPHTHWDREWYEPFQTFRMRLVELVDQLLERMERDPRLRFTLDGQTATIDDYLEVRPNAEPLIRRLVAEGRLAVGPWQILMDEFLVSGETLVRNLELGWARATSLGGAMPIGYLPDMFGHVAQMPQLLRRAGIGQAVVWRGVPAAIDRNTFRWVAPDGSEVETEYLVGGYGNGAYLFDVPVHFAAKLVGYRAASAPFYGHDSVLAMYGTDHAVPSPHLADLVEAVNREDGGIEVRLETLADYMARPRQDDRPAARWTGELRSGARANMLMGVSSARIDLKAACGRVERLLERYAEPLTALHGDEWPDRLLELAWRRVVDNSAHDSICGCSVDAVVTQVLTRFAEAEQLGRGIVERTGRRIAAAVPVGSWAAINPSPRPRTDLVFLDAAAPASGALALASGDTELVWQELSRAEPLETRFRLRGDEVAGFIGRRRHGRELFGKWLNGSRVDSGADVPTITLLIDEVSEPPELDVDELVEEVAAAAGTMPESPWDLVVETAERRRVLVQVPVPALGWATVEPSAAARAVARGPRVVGTDRSLSNGLVDVVVDDDGTVRLSGKGSELVGVGRLVDGGDFGDSYNYGPPAVDRVVDAPRSVTIRAAASGPLLGELVVTRSYAWPVAVEPSGESRSDREVETEVVTRLELRADEPFVRVRISFENRSRDHRLRWHIPLPSPAAGSAAEGQYAVVERGLTAEGGHGEVPLPTFPARGFVHASGVSVLLDHLTEYELVDDGRELAVTILRSIGLISRNANPYRVDPAGPEVPVPNGQCIGPWSVGFALVPHAGGWSEAGVLAAAERYQHPLLAVRGTSRAPEPGGAPEPSRAAEPSRAPEPARAPAAGLAVEGDGVVMTALRRRDEWLELRLVAEHPVPTEAVITGPFREARRVDLLGRDLGPLGPGGPSIRLPLAAWEIATLRLR